MFWLWRVFFTYVINCYMPHQLLLTYNSYLISQVIMASVCSGVGVLWLWFLEALHCNLYLLLLSFIQQLLGPIMLCVSQQSNIQVQFSPVHDVVCQFFLSPVHCQLSSAVLYLPVDHWHETNVSRKQYLLVSISDHNCLFLVHWFSDGFVWCLLLAMYTSWRASVAPHFIDQKPSFVIFLYFSIL